MSLYHLGKEGNSPCIIIAWLALDGVGSHLLYVLYKEIHLPTTLSYASKSVGHAELKKKKMYCTLKRKLKKETFAYI
jgi:hypothetical protein